MPTDRHLDTVEITDFAPGLWSAGNSFLMPAEGWQTMTDCRPEVGGGVRAAMKPTTWSTTGITNLSTSSVLALISFGGQGTAGADERYIWMKDTTSTLIRVFRCVDDTTWTAVTTHAYDAADPGPLIQVDTFKKSSGTQYVLYIVWQNGQQLAIEGLWEIDRSAGTAAAVDTGIRTDSLCVMDDIAVIASGPTLYFSAPGTTTMDHVNRFLDVQASRWESIITGMVYMAPSDLLCATNSTVWSRIQGSLETSPVVRSMSDAHTLQSLQNLNMSDTGILFFEQGVGIVATGDGSSFEVLSTQLESTDFSTGDISAQDNVIICPNGHAFDVRTRAWYRLSNITSSLYHYNARRDNRIIVATSGVSPTFYEYVTGETSRASSYTLKSAPIRGADGRRTKIRQVQIVAQAFNTGDNFTVTVNGTARASGSLTAGRHIIPFLFREEAEVLDVQVVATAAASGEAPQIEALRISRAMSHRST